MLVGLHCVVLVLSLGFTGATSETSPQTKANVISDLIQRLENLATLEAHDAAENLRKEHEFLLRVKTLEATERKIPVLEKSLSKQLEEIASLKQELESLTQQHNSMMPRSAGRSYVNFYAYLSQKIPHLNHGKIVFDDVIENVGHGYNKYTGAFTCTVPGSYFFEWDMYPGGGQGHYVSTDLMRNGVSVSFAKAGTTEHLAMTGSSAAVLQLAVGDTVWVKISGFTNYNTVLYSKITKFSGFRIK